MKNIFFPEEKLRFIKECKDKRCTALLEMVLKTAENILEKTPLEEQSVQVDGEGFAIQHENYGNAAGPFSSDMSFLSFAYEFTGDEKYYLKAKELMMAYCAYSRWHGKGAIGKGELTTGNFLVGMSYGWAAFSHKFTTKEKEYIANRTYTLGIRAQLDDWLLPETRIHCFDTMGHNWWPVCVSTGALAAITMSDYLADGKELADKAAKGLSEWFSYKGNPINMKPATLDNGAFYEGVNYLNYALFEYLTFSIAYLSVTGKAPFDDKKIIESAADFFINTFYPSTKEDYVVNFGDCDEIQSLSALPLMLSRFPELGVLRFYLKHRPHTENNDILSKLINFRELYIMEETVPERLSVCYENIGWAVFRESFNDDSHMLAVKCGDSWNHAHCDAGHFIFYRNGIPEISDPGCCSYGNEIYRDYFVQSAAHNVVLINGKGQFPDDHHHHVRPKGELYNFIDSGSFRYVCADISGPMGRMVRKHLRHFIWVGDIILIYDDIWAYEESEMNFLLHSEQNCCFRMLTPAEERTEKGFIGKDIKEITFKSFNRKTDSYGRGKLISALCLNEEKEPVFEEITDGYKVTYGKIKIYINILSDNRVMHRNCFNTFDGITTDAAVLIDNGGKLAVVNGSTVRKDGKSVFESLYRITDRIN